MRNSSDSLKTFVLNAIDFMSFGFGLYRKGVCDERIKNEYKLVENCEIRGYTKKEASKMLNISDRQFDRRIRKGEIPKGRKYKGFTELFWDKDTIDKMSKV